MCSVLRRGTVLISRIPSPQIQSLARMHQARKRYRDRLQYFRDHVSTLEDKDQ